MKDKSLSKIKYLRERTGCPYWAIECCLITNDYDTDKAYKELIDIYNCFGDHPEVVVKRSEQALKERTKKYE